jgi:hypothetical protein
MRLAPQQSRLCLFNKINQNESINNIYHFIRNNLNYSEINDLKIFSGRDAFRNFLATVGRLNVFFPTAI